MSYMAKDMFAREAFGKVALKQMGDVGDDFMLLRAKWFDENKDVMEVSGAELSPNKGTMIPGTEKTVYITASEIEAYRGVEE